MIEPDLRELLATWRKKAQGNEQPPEWYPYDIKAILKAMSRGQADARRQCADELEAALPAPATPEHIDRDYFTPLQRFVQRSRVKPTEEQIAWTLALLDKFRMAIRK